VTNDKHPPLLTSFLIHPASRVLLLCAFHAVVFTSCYIFAWLLRFEFAIPAEYLGVFKSSALTVLSVQLLTGALFGFYRGWWRYVGIYDVIRLVFGLTVSVALLTALWYTGGLFGLPDRYIHTPRGVLLIDWSFAVLTLFGARVVVRVGRDRMRGGERAQQKRVIIVGAGDAGETLAREIEHRPQLGMKVVAFVDDQRAKWNAHIRGIAVHGPIANISKIANACEADEALIAIPSASGKRLREIIRQLADADLRFKTIPGIDHLVTGKVHVSQLRPVNVEDLLRRERIDLPGDPVRALFRGKRVLITGAGGTIGSELAIQVLQYQPASLELVERAEYALYQLDRRLQKEQGWSAEVVSQRLMDIRDTRSFNRLLLDAQPHIVLHAAAHKHVPIGEENPAEYVRNNAIATRRVAEACRDAKVKRFVFISTDKAINPTSVMGATKRAAEIALLDLVRGCSMKLNIVRFGNVIGSSGSVIPLFLEQIQAGGPVTVTHPEMTRYFLRTSEAVSLVLQAATLGDGGHIFMLDMGEPVRIADLARDLIQLSNHSEEEIPIIYTGLRPGEKLYEEVRLQGESIRPTLHPQIVITEQAQPPSSRVAEWLERTEAIPVTSGAAVVAALKDIIPEYTLPPHWVAAVPQPAAPRETVRATESESPRAPRGLRSEVPA
jgi:FlaA1/EpsC-like NDP-sugar epimerase